MIRIQKVAPSPDKLAAEKEIKDLLAITWTSGTHSANAAKGSVRTRLAEASPSGSSSKPTVVFYTSGNPASQRATANTFDPMSKEAGCFYTRYAKMVKTDVSSVGKERDPVINKDTAPIIAVYGADGKLGGVLESRYINESAFCQLLTRVLRQADPQAKIPAAMTVDSSVSQIRKLVEQKYRKEQDLKEAHDKMREAKSSSSKSTAQRKVDALEKEVNKLDEQIAALQAKLEGE